jgi:methionyl-tRNA synthetase
MEAVLYMLAETVRCIAIMLQPFMPDSAQKLLKLVGYSEEEAKAGVPFTALSPSHALKPGTILPTPEGVFPRYVEKEEAEKKAV